MSRFSFFPLLLKTSIRASITQRGAFLVELMMMVANNLIFFVIWWIFFTQFRDVNSWNFQDMTTLLCIGFGAYGCMQICFGGLKYLSFMIVNGDLDALMTQPKNLLLRVASSYSHSRGWGHLLTCVILLYFGDLLRLEALSMVLFGIFSGCVVFSSFSIFVHSLAFWMGNIESVAKRYCDALFLFALYPTNIYSGVLQIVMFTLIPAGVISYLPVMLIRDFSLATFVTLCFSVLALLCVATFTFYRGLRRYESGNNFRMY